MAPKLVAEEGNLKGLVLSLDNGEQWTIGRDPDECQLLIEDPSASRKHLLCRATPEGVVAENLSDTNPVQVNNEDMTEPLLLQNGDSVRIGSGTFRFYAEEEAQVFNEPSEDEEEAPEEAVEAPSEDEEEAEPPLEEGKAAETPKASPEPEKAPPGEETSETPEASPEPEKAPPGEDISEAPESAPEPEKAPAEEKATETPETAPAPEEEPLIPEGEEEEEEEEEKTKHDTIFEEETHEDKDTLAHISFDMLEAGRWLLKVVGGPNNGAEFSMQSGTSYLLGTDPTSCDIVFHDTSVSRQHARINVDEEDKLTIEDLNSRNGTLVNGKPIAEKTALESNALVTVGTTSFVVYDREGKMQTIISPLLPSIVKTLQHEEEEKEKEKEKAVEEGEKQKAQPEDPERTAETVQSAMGAFILIGILTGLFIIVGIGTVTLFKGEPIEVKKTINTTELLADALKPFPTVQYSFNSQTGRLLLVGHVLTATEKNQLLYNLQGLAFIKHLDDTGIVIDEYVWREINQVLNNDPRWKGITIHSPTPGRFVVSGYLETRRQSEQLSDYLSSNFPYLDLLERRVIVEEDVTSTVGIELQKLGIKEVTAQMSNGVLTLTGGIAPARQKEYLLLVKEFEKIPGIRGVKNFATVQAAEELMVNISERYEVTGSSRHKGKMSVVIDGRILREGDVLDGMTITNITRNTVFLKKGTTEYRIDF